MKTLRMVSLLLLMIVPYRAFGWGDDGHKTVALIAERYLEPAVRAKIGAMLDADPDSLTPHDLASEATWADKYRDSNNRRDHYEQTQDWHFVDLEINDPDIKVACFGRAALVAGAVASNGPPKACIVDKIDQFLAELRNPKTDFEERLSALKFLLHFVGDLHQPLHAADNHDRGGNGVKVWSGSKALSLHHLWDVEFVRALAGKPGVLAQGLLMQITPAQAATWRAGAAEDWAWEAFAIAQEDVYGDPPLSGGEVQQLDGAYVKKAKADVALQLSRAGVRLAYLLNQALK
jgi:S1/P1 Nuclease